MTPVKENQKELVSYILESGLYGPLKSSDVSIKFPEQNYMHLDFIIEQLDIAGAISNLSDGRFVTTSNGEEMLENLNKTQHIVSQVKNNTISC